MLHTKPVFQSVLDTNFPKTNARGACRPPRATDGPRLQARQGGLVAPLPPQATGGGAVAPLSGDQGFLPYISVLPPFPPHLSPKISPKIQKKDRGEEKGTGEALPDSALMICRLVHLVYVFFH